MSLLDDLLGIGASFDWISPLASVLGDLMNGPSHTFLVPLDASPMTGREIESMLRAHKVRTWGAMVVSGTFMVTVPEPRAQYAERILEQNGVPLENPTAPPKRTGSVFDIFS